MKVNIHLVDSVGMDYEEFDVSALKDEVSISIYVDENITLKEQLNNKEKFDYCMNEAIQYQEYFDENLREEFDEEYGEISEPTAEELKKDYVYLSENFDKIFANTTDITIYFNRVDEGKFILDNPEIVTKNVYLENAFKINDFRRLKSLMKAFKNNMDNIHVKLEGNSDYISLLDCSRTMCLIKDQADAIKKLQLSPIEATMYAYDQVRNRVYKSENEDEEISKSRDLSEVVFGDKIVCLGYSNVFSAILDYLGIKNEIVLLNEKDSEEGHARNAVRIKDKKYKIDGVYYFDATWDSKKKEGSNNYLYSYKHFAKTKNAMDELDDHNYIELHLKNYSKNMYDKIKTLVAEKKYSEIRPYMITIGNMAEMLDIDLDYYKAHFVLSMLHNGQIDEEKFLKQIKKVINKYNKEIPAEVMINVLNNVRKLEYYQDPKWYPYSLSAIYTAGLYSDWKFKDYYLSNDVRLILSIFGTVNEKDVTFKEMFQNYIKQTNIEEDINQVTLTRTLKTICEEKTRNR